MLQTPIVFIIFNRPDTTVKAFERIRAEQPKQLFVIADGPRTTRPNEAEKCAAARAIINQVDWDCEVQTNYSEENLGCKRRISSGLDWVFGQVERAIILEDDCIPQPSFFPYCEELLERYHNDERIMTVSGDNFQFGTHRTNESYYFSHYNHCWGWATWRRAWKLYDIEMRNWPAIRDENWLPEILGDLKAANYWTAVFERAYQNQIDSWAIRMQFACLIQNGLTALPCANLVSNIGFGGDATHTDAVTRLAFMKTYPMEMPLRHPPFIIRNTHADDYTQRTVFDAKMSFQARLKRKCNKILGRTV